MLFFPVSFDGCTADMDSQWLLKYSLQRAGVKQSHILLLFYSSGLTFLQQSQHCKHLSALNKKTAVCRFKRLLQLFFWPDAWLVLFNSFCIPPLFNNHAQLKALPLLSFPFLMSSKMKYSLLPFFSLKVKTWIRIKFGRSAFKYYCLS